MSINRTLYYPDTVICTLKVEDLNDNKLSVESVIIDSLNKVRHDFDTVPWPGNYFLIEEQYGTKEIILTLPGCCMGTISGSLFICDAHNASAMLPFSVQKYLRDTFAISSPDAYIWMPYALNDTAWIHSEFYLSNYLMRFFLDSGSVDQTVGLRSRYGIAGDCCIAIVFGLKENMNELSGLEVSFFTSTSQDTGEYSGVKAGFEIYSDMGLLHAKAGMGFNMKSQVINFFTGNMQIERMDSTMNLYCWDERVQSDPIPFKTVSFPASDTLFVHLRMSVDSLNNERFCRWDNFIIEKGEIIY